MTKKKAIAKKRLTPKEKMAAGGRARRKHGIDAVKEKGLAEAEVKFGARMDEIDLLTRSEAGRIELARQGLVQAHLMVSMGIAFLAEVRKEKGAKVYDEALLKRFGSYMEIARRHLADYHRMAPPDVEGAPGAEILRMDELLEAGENERGGE